MRIWQESTLNRNAITFVPFGVPALAEAGTEKAKAPAKVPAKAPTKSNAAKVFEWSAQQGVNASGQAPVFEIKHVKDVKGSCKPVEWDYPTELAVGGWVWPVDGTPMEAAEANKVTEVKATVNASEGPNAELAAALVKAKSAKAAAKANYKGRKAAKAMKEVEEKRSAKAAAEAAAERRRRRLTRSRPGLV